MKKLSTFIALTFILSSTFLKAQSTTDKTTTKVKVFLDCTRPWLCDEEFLRTELKMVDYVRDRFLSDVHIILNTQFAGGGGEQNELILRGLNNFSNMQDTIRYFNNPTTTDDERRQKLLKNLKLGLIRYVMQSPAADNVEISFKENKKDVDNQASSPKKDPWNYWQFSFGTSGFFNGDQNYSSQNINMNVSANRETEKSRFGLDFTNNINRQKITVSPDEKVNIKTDEQGMDLRYAVKVTEHWAYGCNGNFIRSVFSNIDARFFFAPRLEYSVLPYKRFNNERITIQYSIGPEYSQYGDTTLYFKTKEVLIKHRLGVNGSFTKPWGSVNIGAGWTNYLDDFDKNNLFIGGGISWRVFKGFQFGVGGNFEFIRDQISLPKSGASRDDVLTRRRLIASNFSYFMGVGFSYRFGSIYNSQVNPTFKGLNYSLNF